MNFSPICKPAILSCLLLASITQSISQCTQNLAITIDGSAESMTICPGDEIEVCFSGEMIPEGGTVTIKADLDGDGILETDLCSEPVPTVPCPMPTSSSGGTVFISSLIPNPPGGDCDAMGTPETITICNGCSCNTDNATVDISGWELDDNTGGTGAGNARHIFPAGTMLASGECITIASTDFNNSGCGSGVWNNTSDDATIHDASGTLVELVSYSGSPAEGEDVLDPCAIVDPVQMVCCDYTVPMDICNTTSVFNFRGEVVSIDPDCSGNSGFISPTFQCIEAEIRNDERNICIDGQNFEDVEVYINGGIGPFTVTYAINGVAQAPLTNFNGGDEFRFTAPAAGEYKVTLISVVDEGGEMCNAEIMDHTYCLDFLPEPDLAVMNLIEPSSCDACDGEITFEFIGTGPFDLEYRYEFDYEYLNNVTSPYTITDLCVGTYELISINDRSGCSDNTTLDEIELIGPGCYDLALEKRAPNYDPVSIGGNASFDITVYNQGNLEAFDVDVEDYFPSCLNYVSSVYNSGGTNSPTITDNGVNGYEISSVLPGESVTVTVTFTVNSSCNQTQVYNNAEIAGGSATDGGPDADDEDSVPGDQSMDPRDDDRHDLDEVNGDDDYDWDFLIICPVKCDKPFPWTGSR